jgi:hypothetical protein
MAGKKSIEEIWKELNAPKPQRSGVAGTVLGALPASVKSKPVATSATSSGPAAPAVTALSSAKAPSAAAGAASPAANGAAGAASNGAAAPDTQGLAVPVLGPDDLDGYRAALQRTINCLADPDRSLRRSAANTLHARLFAGDATIPAVSPAQLQSLLAPGPLLRPLVAMLSDSMDRCRAVALSVFLDAVPQLSDVEPLLPELLPALAARFGTLPVQETAEEASARASRPGCMPPPGTAVTDPPS